MRFVLTIGVLHAVLVPVIQGWESKVSSHVDFDNHIDFDADYWDERRKLSKLNIGSNGEIFEEYHQSKENDIEGDYYDDYSHYILDEKEEMFESLPENMKVDHADETSHETGKRKLFGALGRGSYESLCGRDNGKPCAQSNFPRLPSTADIDQKVCEPWNTVFNGTMNFTEGVVIPEYTCVTLGAFKSGEVLEFGDVINIIGKLFIPDGTKVTLKFPMMYIQGKLTIYSNQVIDDDPDVKFILTGKFKDPDRYFVPYGPNEGICPSGGCLIGKNGIVVAGGQVLIEAIPKNCPTWTKIEYIDSLPMPTIALEDRPHQALLPENTTVPCTDKVIDEDFSESLNYFHGGAGPIEELTNVNHDSNYMKISKRKADWMGPLYELSSEEKECMIPDEIYYFSVRLRLSRPDGNKTLCSETGEKCPELVLGNMNSLDQIRWFKLASVFPDETKVVDGEWFTFNAKVTFNEQQLDPSDVFTSLIIRGPEEGVDIDVDDYSLRLPPKEVYPPEEDTCKNLIINGDGDVVPGFAYPMTSWLRSDPLKLLYDENNKPYFHIGPRKEEYSTITFDIMPKCLVDSSTYKFRARVWVHSDEPVRARAIIKAHHPRGTLPRPYHRDFHFDTLTICDESSEEIGWVTCEETIKWEWYHYNSTRIQFLFITQGSTADMSYANLELTHLKGQESGLLKLPEEIYGCWGVGPSVFITSETFVWDEDKTANITSVSPDGMIGLDVDEHFETPSSVAEQGLYAPEIALMRRNVLWEAEHDPDDPYFGGFFIVLKTPEKQVIEGVEIRNFGQQRNYAKYPINFYHGGNHNRGTRISKNYIQDSNLRGIVITGTRNVNITENVMYNISGHGVCMEDGSEVRNTIQYNLGARIIPIIIENNWWYQEQDDRARFIMIKNPKNHFIGNVATGGFWSGFWTQLHRSLHGESRTLFPPMNPQRQPMLTFKDNVAHSNRKSGFQFHPTYWWPRTEQTLVNTIAYRNMWFGIYFFGTENVHLKGGLVADNRIGIDLNYVDMVRVTDFEVIGYSNEYKDYADSVQKKRLCWEFEEELSPPIYGIRLHANLMDHFHEYGTILQNVTFKRIDDGTGCIGSKSIYMNPIYKDEIYSNKIEITNATFDEDTRMDERFSICDAQDAKLIDIGLYNDGSLHPEGLDEPGWIVSNNTNMTNLPDKCYPMEDTCASYCVGSFTCMTKITVEIEYNDDDEGTLSLLVEDQDGYVRNIKGYKYNGISEEQTTTNWSSRRHFAVTVPQGNYTASFWKDGEMLWPGFAEPYIVYNWMCDERITSFDMIIPEPEANYCDTLTKNGNMEKSTIIGESRWHDTNGGLKFVTPGYNSNQAISNIERKKLGDGISQFLDQRCLVLGERWMISAKVKLSNNVDCDTMSESKKLDPMCPRFSIYGQYGKGIKSDTTDVHVGYSVPPWKPGEWNQMVGTFTITPLMLEGNSTSIFVDGSQFPELIILDDVETWRYDPKCEDGEEFILNSHIDGDLSYWKYTGAYVRHRTGLELVNNAEKGYGEGYSMATVNREEEWHGMYQPMIVDCMQAGREYEVLVNYRLEEEWGDAFECDPFLAYVLTNACPRPRLKWAQLNGPEYYMDIGYPIGPHTPGQWHTAQGIFTVTEQQLNATNERVEFFFGKSWPHRNIIMDSYSVKFAKPGTMGEAPSCNELVVNGDAEIGDARYWFIKGKEDYGTVSMVSPGRGASGYAFHHHGDRTRHYMGMWQKLPTQCLGMYEWKVVAYFKLFDPSGNEVSCDKSKKSGDTRCPVMFFQGHTPYQGVYHTGPLWNTAPGGWQAGDWNEYSAIFKMDDGFAAKTEVWFYVHNVLPGYSYYVDDISITRA